MSYERVRHSVTNSLTTIVLVFLTLTKINFFRTYFVQMKSISCVIAFFVLLFKIYFILQLYVSVNLINTFLSLVGG